QQALVEVPGPLHPVVRVDGRLLALVVALLAPDVVGVLEDLLPRRRVLVPRVPGGSAAPGLVLEDVAAVRGLGGAQLHLARVLRMPLPPPRLTAGPRHALALTLAAAHRALTLAAAHRALRTRARAGGAVHEPIQLVEAAQHLPALRVHEVVHLERGVAVLH